MKKPKPIRALDVDAVKWYWAKLVDVNSIEFESVE